jgi:hypothetical protein
MNAVGTLQKEYRSGRPWRWTVKKIGRAVTV